MGKKLVALQAVSENDNRFTSHAPEVKPNDVSKITAHLDVAVFDVVHNVGLNREAPCLAGIVAGHI